MNKKPVPMWARIAIIVIVVGALVACYFVISNSKNKSSNTNQVANEDNNTTDVSNKEGILKYEDDLMKVYYLDACEVDGVEGVFYLTIKVDYLGSEDSKVMVSLSDVYVNDEVVNLPMSGTPLYIIGGRSGTNAFIISYSTLSIDKLSEVKNIKFKVELSDADTMKTIATSKEIELKAE